MKSPIITSARPPIDQIRKDLDLQRKYLNGFKKELSPDEMKTSFLELCVQNAFSHANNHVSVNFDRFIEVVGKLELPDSKTGFDFSPNMTPEAADRTKPINPERVMFDLAMNVANQGGFIYVGDDGKARKWETKGSGARAFNDLFHGLNDKNLLPGLPNSKITGPQDVDRLIGPQLIQADGKDAPFKADRLAVFKEFASPDAWSKIESIVDYAKKDSDNFAFDFKSVRDISRAFPISFGQDPFYKKAALLPILFANNANTRGKNVTVSGIVAADYRLPQTLHSIGVLDFSPELVERIENEEIMSPDDLMVVQMRAASIYACDLLSKYSGMQINEVDAALWKAMKDGSLQSLQEETILQAQKQGRKITLKQMLVPTFSFAKIPPIFYPTVAAGVAAAKAMIGLV